MTTHNDSALTTAIKVRLPAAMHDQLSARADSGVLSLSDHVRMAIELYLRTPSSIPPANGFVETRETR